jgi:enterobactin synthetase component D / holo-[acyl-carrier protein] synthase
MRGPGDPLLLLPAEAENLGRAVAKRKYEYAAGRLCARRALAEFGIVGFPLRAADDRRPLWPESMIGSITHTADFCAAVVAESRRIRALGLDSEIVGQVTSPLWPTICAPREIAWLRSLPVSEQPPAATLIFSAKEAFYKCQYPLARDRLDFLDAVVEAATWPAPNGTFSIHVTRRIAFAVHAAMPLQGRYLFHEDVVSAGIAVAAGVDGMVGGTGIEPVTPAV